RPRSRSALRPTRRSTQRPWVPPGEGSRRVILSASIRPGRFATSVGAPRCAIGSATIGAMADTVGSSVSGGIKRRVMVAPGVELHVEVRLGDRAAAPFVLVHGLASNARLWDGVAEHLHAAGHTVVVIDQRGHGLSDAPESGYDLETAVGDLLT